MPSPPKATWAERNIGTGSDYDNALAAFIAAHQTAGVAQVESWLSALPAPGPGTPAAFDKNLFKAAYSAALGTDSAVRPKAYVATGPAVSIANDQPVFPGLEIEAGDPLIGDHFQLEIVKTSEIALKDGPAGGGVSLMAMATGLKGIKRDAGVGTNQMQYVVCRIFHDDGTTKTDVATFIQSLFTDAGPGAALFPKLTPNLMRFEPKGQTTVAIDSSFELGLDADPTLYDAEARVLEGHGSVTKLDGTAAMATGAPPSIENFVQDLVYKPMAPAAPQRATILITIKLAGSIKALALRTIVFDAGPLVIRNGVCDVIAKVKTIADLKDDFTPIKAELGQVGDTRTLHGLLSKSDSIDGQLRHDLQILGAGGASAALAESMRRLQGAIATNLSDARLSELTAQQRLTVAHGLISAPASLLETAAQVSGALTDYDHLDTQLADWGRELDQVESDAVAVRKKLFDLGSELLQDLLVRRTVLVARLEEPKIRYRASFEGGGTEQQTALQKLDSLFNPQATAPSSLRWRLDQLGALIKHPRTIDHTTTTADVKGAEGTILRIKDEVFAAIPVIESRVSNVADGDRIVKRWKEVLEPVNKPVKAPIPPRPPITSAQALGSLLVSGGDVGGLAASLSQLAPNSSLWLQLLGALAPAQRRVFYSSLRRFPNTTTPGQTANSPYALRNRASLFGWNAPNVVKTKSTTSGTTTTTEIQPEPRLLMGTEISLTEPLKESSDRLFVDGRAEKTAPSSPIAIFTLGGADPELHWGRKVLISPRSAYEVSADTTRLDLANGWWTPAPGEPSFNVLRGTKVWCDAEELTLSEKLIVDDAANVMIPGAIDDQGLQLDDVYPDLMAGMKVVISGVPYQEEEASNSSPPQRDDGKSQVVFEVATISGVKHGYDNSLYGDAFRTTIALERPLSRRYWRDTVEIQANVVEATHGETVHEPLGSGEARRAFQKFELSSTPLTRLSKGDLDGQEPALEVRVNKVRWDRADRLYDREPQSESYELLMTREGQARVQFGDGVQGARLPTGEGNIRATYRKRLGLAGNVDIGRIDQLPAPPLGVKSVINPVGGDGGADPDSVWQSKLRIPLSPIRAGKLISRRDYESFALLFAGVEKARADVVGGGVELTVAGPSPGPLRLDGKLIQSLSQAIELYGDPQVPCQVAPHAGKLLYVEAQLEIDERADWSDVKQRVREALLQRFGYREAQLGQEVLASDVVATIQQVPHVLLVELQSFFGITSEQAGAEKPVNAADQLESRVCVAPHELCYIAGVVDNTILLEPRT